MRSSRKSRPARYALSLPFVALCVLLVCAFLLGGGAAFAAHAGKASARAAINTSPEPVSNVVASTAEDVATVGLLALAFANPVIAAVIAAVLLVLSIVLIVVVGRTVRRVLKRTPKPNVA